MDVDVYELVDASDARIKRPRRKVFNFDFEALLSKTGRAEGGGR